MTFEECLEKGLIRQSGNASERVQQSLELGDRFYKSAGKNLDIGEYVVCELISYNSVFHYARAMLFAKGFIERSHACLFIALQKYYPENKEMILKADKFRVERHNLQYSGLLADEASAKFAKGLAKDFGNMAKAILNNLETDGADAGISTP